MIEATKGMLKSANEQVIAAHHVSEEGIMGRKQANKQTCSGMHLDRQDFIDRDVARQDIWLYVRLSAVVPKA